MFTVTEQNRKWHERIPSPTGIGMLVPASAVVTMFLGAMVGWLVQRRRGAEAESWVLPLASGLIAGEALVAIIMSAVGDVRAAHVSAWTRARQASPQRQPRLRPNFGASCFAARGGAMGTGVAVFRRRGPVPAWRLASQSLHAIHKKLSRIAHGDN